MPFKEATTRITEAHTDLGEFTAIASTWSVDRQGDVVTPGAFTETIARWRRSGKQIPLHWNHSARAEHIIGSVDPKRMRETPEGLLVRGGVDLGESAIAREAWRSMRANRVSLSFGYRIDDELKRADGIRELRALDLFEVSITPAPANAETRIISTKGVRRPLQIASFEC
jgi:uncharacterized protein